jgi:hypothetical protein
MERHRLAVVLAGLVLAGGAVAALRLANGTPDVHATPPSPPSPTEIKPYSAEGVLAPAPGDRPAAPDRLVVVGGPRRLQVRWGADLPGGRNPAGAAGYEVLWGPPGSLGNPLLVAEPAVELDDLPPRRDIQVRVESVDAYGQRSAPVTGVGQALPDTPAGADNAMVDHFDGAQAPDPRLWRIADVGDCAQAVPDEHRLVLLNECGQSSVTLRSRVPFRLRDTTSGELGRFTIDTDAPGETGELAVDLVPGAVNMVDGSPNDPIATAPPDTAVVDDNLPPGTVRVRVDASVNVDTDLPSDTVQVAVGRDVPTVPRSRAVTHVIPPPTTGMSVRWDLVLRTDGIQVLRDGVHVGGANVVPGWAQATALVEFTGTGPGQQRDDVTMIGFGGAPTSAPPTTTSPAVAPVYFIDTAADPAMARPAAAGPGSGLLLMTVLAKPNSPNAPVTVDGGPPVFTVRVGNGGPFPATPAVPGTTMLPLVRYPLVARIPADLLNGARNLPIRLTAAAPSNYPVILDLEQAEIDVTAGPHAPAARLRPGPGIIEIPPQLGGLRARVLDASGDPPADGGPLPRGRAVLDITMDGVAGERSTGRLAGLAGFTAWLDNIELVAVPTAVDGPGIAGEWQVAFDTNHQRAGQHTIDVRALGTERGVPFAETFAGYRLRP